MLITVSDIQGIFNKYNSLCFDGKLPLPRIRIGHAKGYLGQLRYKVKKDKSGKATYSDFSLNFTQRYEMDQEKLEDVVIHEMIHYYIHYNNIQDTSAHGVVFRKMMDDINIRFKRNITISDRSGLPVSDESQQIKMHLVCVATLKSGDTGVAVCARTRAFEIYDELPRRYDILKFSWYFTSDQYFNRFKRTNTAKLYRADKEEVSQHLATAAELERVGNVIRPKRKK
jgi:hypothetical protein